LTTIEEVKRRAEADAKTFGYYLNADPNFLQGLLEGLKQNEERYGYPSCPCRLASGNLDYDRDIICPCDYRDPDVAQFGACYCGLYVRRDVYERETELRPVPERRPIEKQMRSYQTPVVETESKASANEEKEEIVQITIGKKKLWYCKQCGYVVFREEPPYICPICKAKRELFAEIKTRMDFSG